MSFGYSVGDFAALGQLAWKVYKACKDAPESFKNISQEVSSLHLVLKELEETYSEAALSATQQSRLKIVGDGCRAVLEDLQCILDKYNSLGTKTKRTWDRLGWGSKDIPELRSRLISNTVLLTTFINTSQVIVQKKLEAFLQEFRDGKHEDSIVSTQTVDSLSTDERQAWRAIRKELEDIGISIAAFDNNKDFIVNWFKTAISTGAFEEQSAEDGSSSILCENDLRQRLEGPVHNTVLSQPLENPGHDTNLTSTPIDLQALELSPGAKLQKRRPPRVAGLINWLFRYNEGLFKAIQSEDETKMQQLLDKGANTNVIDDDGCTPLHHAVSLKSEVMVRLLLENGADVNAKNYHKATALHLAANFGHETIVQLLLINGAEINEEDADGYTALHTAASREHVTLVRLLLKSGANINKKDKYGYTALHWAAHSGYDAVVYLLSFSFGVEIDGRDRQGITALHWAANFGHETVVQLLLKRGANINKRDGNGYTALHWASNSRHWTVVQLLQKNGAGILEQDWPGYTALHWAAISEH